MKHRLTTPKSILIFAASTVVLIGAIIAACFITHAAFTNSLRAQRTIAAYESIRDLFSSNFLLKSENIGENNNVKMVYVTNENATPTTVISVCNYPQGNHARYSEDHISYTLSMEYVVLENDNYKPISESSITNISNYITGISVNDNDDYDVTLIRNGSNVTVNALSASSPDRVYSDTIQIMGGTATSHTYTLQFGQDFIKEDANLFVKITATPSNINLPTLSCIFVPDLRAAGAQNRWIADFTDDQSVSPASYDGFNYRLTGEGNTTIMLTWLTDYVTLSYYSRKQILDIANATITENTNNHTETAVFNVDSDVRDLYDFQFYKTGSFESVKWPETENETDMYDIIQFDFS